MAGTIGTDSVTLSQNWGAITFNDYTFDGMRMDFQDLMVAVAEKRAVAVEGEVTPMSVRMRARNTDLDRAGALLAIFTKAQANFDSDAEGDDTTKVDGITKEQYAILSEAYKRTGGTPPNPITDSWANSKWSKSRIEGMIQAIKSMIDSMNNEAQTDMSRLQSLVDRRDESFSTATNLMTRISDTRSNLIRNL